MMRLHDFAVRPHPQREFATEIVRKLRSAGFVAYFAGGCVRDLLLGRAAKDYDVATNATPQQVRELFGHRKTLAVGESFGVIIVIGPKTAGTVEVATFRTDLEYTDGRRPNGVVYCSPEEDAQRRDFTINGMFYDPVESRVLDFVGGENDLGARVVRAIRRPRDRMEEDKLRMLRAVRFAATLEFELDAATATAVRELAPKIVVVSAERIAQEFRKMLVDPHRRRALQLCRELGLLEVLLPELFPASTPVRPMPEVSDRVAELGVVLSHLQTPRFETAMAALLQDLPTSQVQNISRRWKLSNDEAGCILWLVDHLTVLESAPQLSLATLKMLLAHPYHVSLLALTHARLLTAGADLHPVLFVEEFLASTPAEIINPAPLISGNDLIQLGVPRGPRFKELLDAVRERQLNLELHSREQALEWVRELQVDSAGGTP